MNEWLRLIHEALHHSSCVSIHTSRHGYHMGRTLYTQNSTALSHLIVAALSHFEWVQSISKTASPARPILTSSTNSTRPTSCKPQQGHDQPKEVRFRIIKGMTHLKTNQAIGSHHVTQKRYRLGSAHPSAQSGTPSRLPGTILLMYECLQREDKRLL